MILTSNTQLNINITLLLSKIIFYFKSIILIIINIIKSYMSSKLDNFSIFDDIEPVKLLCCKFLL